MLREHGQHNPEDIVAYLRAWAEELGLDADVHVVDSVTSPDFRKALEKHGNDAAGIYDICAPGFIHSTSSERKCSSSAISLGDGEFSSNPSSTGSAAF